MKKKTPPQSPGSRASLTAEIIPSKTPSSKKTNGKPAEKSNGKVTSFNDDLDNQQLLKVLSEVRHGNFSVRMPIDKVGLNGKICDTLNEIIALNETLVGELTQARK